MGNALQVPVTLSDTRLAQAQTISPARVESSDLRVEFVWDMMIAGEYIRGRTDKELARVWGIGVDAVHQYTAVASKLIRLQYAPERNEETKALMLHRILHIGEASMNRTEEVVDVKGNIHEVRRPDMRTALASIVEFSQLLGIRTNKHEVRVTASDLSDAELHERLAKIVEADPGLQEKLQAMGYRREVQTTGTEVPEEPKK